MRLNEEYLERAEELFDLFPNIEGDIELDLAIDRLRIFLENDVDGWTQLSREELAMKTLSHLEDLLDLIPPPEQGSDLNEALGEFMVDLENDATGAFDNEIENKPAIFDEEAGGEEEELWD